VGEAESDGLHQFTDRRNTGVWVGEAESDGLHQFTDGSNMCLGVLSKCAVPGKGGRE
jgi:hypothetical protein